MIALMLAVLLFCAVHAWGARLIWKASRPVPRWLRKHALMMRVNDGR